MTSFSEGSINNPMILSLAISIMVVYFLVLLISWLLEKKRADQMMKDLEMYQQNVDR